MNNKQIKFYAMGGISLLIDDMGYSEDDIGLSMLFSEMERIGYTIE